MSIHAWTSTSVAQEQAYKDKERLEDCAKEHPGDISKIKGMARDMLNSFLSQIGQMIGSQATSNARWSYTILSLQIFSGEYRIMTYCFTFLTFM